LTEVPSTPLDIRANPSLRPGALKALGLEAEDGAAPMLWCDADASRALAKKLDALGLESRQPYAVVHAHGSTPRQRWPHANVVPLASALRHELRLNTVVVGSAEQGDDADAPWLVDTTGKLSVAELVALVAGATVVVTTDSGPFHIAGALGRPAVGLFRALRPEHANRYPTGTALMGDHLACIDRCSWDRCRGQDAVYQTMPCWQLESIGIPEVVTAVAALTSVKEPSQHEALGRRAVTDGVSDRCGT
jgi:hypothetical protein